VQKMSPFRENPGWGPSPRGNLKDSKSKEEPPPGGGSSVINPARVKTGNYQKERRTPKRKTSPESPVPQKRKNRKKIPKVEDTDP